MEKLPHNKNGLVWGNSEEDLLAKWADKATCYRWMHDNAQKKFYTANMRLTLPVIVLSTLTGTANFGMGSIFPPNLQGIAQLGIGAVSLITGIISTIGNFLEYAQNMEAHRGASVSWGKLHRKISVELSLPRIQREPCAEFLIVCRSELDRLIEQSPAIPDNIIIAFKREFPGSELANPVKWNDMEKTRVHAPPKVEPDVPRAVSRPPIRADVKKEIVEEVLRRQSITPPPQQTVQDDLHALRSYGLVSQFFNAVAKTPRSQRTPEPEPEPEPDAVKIDIPTADTCPESECAHESALPASDAAPETPSQPHPSTETHTS